MKTTKPQEAAVKIVAPVMGVGGGVAGGVTDVEKMILIKSSRVQQVQFLNRPSMDWLLKSDDMIPPPQGVIHACLLLLES